MLQDCEDEVGRTTNDPVTMEAVLNRLQVLQDKAISQGVYALESKVCRIVLVRCMCYCVVMHPPQHLHSLTTTPSPLIITFTHFIICYQG